MMYQASMKVYTVHKDTHLRSHTLT